MDFELRGSFLSFAKSLNLCMALNWPLTIGPTSFLLPCCSFEFAQSMSDYYLFTCAQGFIAILVHADDILIASNDLPSINKLKAGILDQLIVQIRGS